MDSRRHTVLCVDDEPNILLALKRLLRKENLNLLTCHSAEQGLELLAVNDVHLVVCDHRMPQMSGVAFLACVRQRYPDVIRIILTGYMDVDTITESINKGHIYKFFPKPWDDRTLVMEIRQALEQYELIQTNKKLHKMVLDQNEELRCINDNLEQIVTRRTQELELQNQMLELSRTILDELPIPILGVSAEGLIVQANRLARCMRSLKGACTVGGSLSVLGGHGMSARLSRVLETGETQKIDGCLIHESCFDLEVLPLGGRFKGKGAIVVLNPPDKC